MTAELVIPCPDLDAALAQLQPLGYRLDTIAPADDPAVCIVSGHGLRLRLARTAGASPLQIAGERVVVPAGVAIEPALTLAEAAPLVPRFTVSRAGDAPWKTGRAGMQYRDLVPDRQGGGLIASHNRIPDGGPVPDYVHYHAVRFQMIYCHSGWVRVVYEDQGEPFVMEPGDCVLQPPQIRHRVLEASNGLEVIELAMPASHATHVDHALALPTAVRDRSYGGQRFVRFRRADAAWRACELAGWQACEIPIAEATGGLARVRVLAGGPDATAVLDHSLAVIVVLRGTVTVADQALAAGDAITLPRDRSLAVRGAASCELLEVAI